MSNFDEIIKQKVEQFNVPYNEVHWAEMNGRLNVIRAAKIKKTVLSTAGAIAVIAISSYFIFFNNETPVKDNTTIAIENNTTKVIIDNNSSPKENVTVNPHKAITHNTIVKNKLEENQMDVVTEEDNNEIIVIDNTPIDKKEENNSIPSEVNTNNTTPNADFIVYNNKVCLGEIVSFEALEKEQPVSYTWSFGDGSISQKANPKHIYKESGVFTVSLTLINRQLGVEKTTTQKNIISILPLPNANFTYSEEATIHDDNKLKYPYTVFAPKVINQLATYKWTFGNGETSNKSTTKTIYSEKEKNYTVTLLAKNLEGCLNNSKVVVFNKNGIDLFAPTGFKPITASSSKTETFIPQALLGWDVQFEMIIIDKSNKIVYKTSDKNEPWNGKLNNTGQLLNEGVYMWQVITYDAEGTPYRHNGQIHLLK